MPVCCVIKGHCLHSQDVIQVVVGRGCDAGKVPGRVLCHVLKGDCDGEGIRGIHCVLEVGRWSHVIASHGLFVQDLGKHDTVDNEQRQRRDCEPSHHGPCVETGFEGSKATRREGTRRDEDLTTITKRL